MNNRANRIVKTALIVCILFWLAMVNQYCENVGVIIDNIKTLFFDGKDISLETEGVVANTSQSTTHKIYADNHGNLYLRYMVDPKPKEGASL